MLSVYLLNKQIHDYTDTYIRIHSSFRCKIYFLSSTGNKRQKWHRTKLCSSESRFCLKWTFTLPLSPLSSLQLAKIKIYEVSSIKSIIMHCEEIPSEISPQRRDWQGHQNINKSPSFIQQPYYCFRLKVESYRRYGLQGRRGKRHGIQGRITVPLGLKMKTRLQQYFGDCIRRQPCEWGQHRS